MKLKKWAKSIQIAGYNGARTVYIYFFRLHNIAVIIPTSLRMVVHNIFLERQLEQSKATILKEEPIWPIKIKICVLDESEEFASKYHFGDKLAPLKN